MQGYGSHLREKRARGVLMWFSEQRFDRRTQRNFILERKLVIYFISVKRIRLVVYWVAVVPVVVAVQLAPKVLVLHPICCREDVR